MSLVRTEVPNGVATVTLCDPDRRNALTLPDGHGDRGHLRPARGRPRRGRRGDHGRRPGLLRRRRPLPPVHVRRWRRRDGACATIYEGFLRIGRSPLPTIAAVNGAAVGAGMNLALVCDVRIAATRARFDTRFLQLGLHPGGGHTWMFRRIAGPAGRARDGALRRDRSTGRSRAGRPRLALRGR